MAQIRVSTVQQRREEVAFTVRWRSGKTVENLSRSRKSRCFVDTTWKLSNTVRSGVRPHADAVAWDAAEAPRG